MNNHKLLFGPSKEVYSLLGQVIFKDFTESVRFCTVPVKCLKLKVFMDGRTCEVFINDGEYSGMKTFYGDGSCLVFSFSASTTTKTCLIVKSMTRS